VLSTADLTSIARARLKDAAALLSKRRYDGAAYLCGYAIESALKARVVKTLKWSDFPSTSSEFSGLQSFKTHDLHMLLRLSGWAPKIKAKYAAEWSVVSQWNPESRYRPAGKVTLAQAESMIESARTIIGVLL
jgi:HEPN domain-containing protein